MNKPTGNVGTYNGIKYEQIKDKSGKLQWRPLKGGTFVKNDQILQALDNKVMKLKGQDVKKFVKDYPDMAGKMASILDPFIGNVLRHQYKTEYTKLLPKKKVQTNNKNKSAAKKQLAKPVIKPAAKQTTKPSSLKPSTTSVTQTTTTQSVQLPEAQVVTQQPVQQVVQQPTKQSSEQFLGAPFIILDENMLNGSSVKDYDTLLDYMYNSPNSSFTRGFMNMVYSNMGNTLDYWNPDQESQWDYLRRNRKAIEKIAGIRGRYGNGLLGTSGDYQDLIRAINGYAKEANRGIMYNKPQQQGYTFYNIYPNQLTPTTLAAIPSDNVININGENLLLGQGWGVRDGLVYDETGRLRTWSPVEQRFLKEGGNIFKYQAGGTTKYKKLKIGKLTKEERDKFLSENDLNLNDATYIRDFQERINTALGGLGYTNNDLITTDGKLGKQTVNAYNFLKDVWDSKSGYDNIGNVFDSLFSKKDAEMNNPTTVTQTETTVTLTGTPTGTPTRTLTRIQRAPTFTSRDVYHIKNDADLLNEIGKGSAIGLSIYRAMLNKGLYNPTINGDFYTWANSPQGLGSIKGAFNLNGKRFKRNWLGVGTTDQDDLVNGLNEANTVFNSRFVDSEKRNDVYKNMNGLYGFSNTESTPKFDLKKINDTMNKEYKFSREFPKTFNINRLWKPSSSPLMSYNFSADKQKGYQSLLQGGQLTEDQKKEQLEFAKFLVEKSGAKTQKELESFVKEQGEEGMKKLYTEFKNKKKQKAKHGLKLKYIDNLKKGSVLAGCGAKIKKNCFGKKLGKGGKNCGCK